MTVLKMTDLDLQGKRVLIREDLNVPVKDGVVASDARILASLPTIKLALEKGAAVKSMVCSPLSALRFLRRNDKIFMLKAPRARHPQPV